MWRNKFVQGIMKKILLVALLVLASIGAGAQSASNTGFGLDKSDKEAVKQIQARMDRIHTEQHRPAVALVLGGGGATWCCWTAACSTTTRSISR